MERRLQSGGGEWLMQPRYRTLNRVPEKAIPAKPMDNFLYRRSQEAVTGSSQPNLANDPKVSSSFSTKRGNSVAVCH